VPRGDKNFTTAAVYVVRDLLPAHFREPRTLALWRHARCSSSGLELLKAFLPPYYARPLASELSFGLQQTGASRSRAWPLCGADRPAAGWRGMTYTISLAVEPCQVLYTTRCWTGQRRSSSLLSTRFNHYLIRYCRHKYCRSSVFCPAHNFCVSRLLYILLMLRS
jgi:hypothetical protein